MEAVKITDRISTDENVQAVYSVLRKSGTQQEQHDFSVLIRQMEFIEEQFAHVVSELQGVNAQLQAIQDKKLGAVAARTVENVKQKVNVAKFQFVAVKETVIISCTNAAKAAKEKGATGLKITLDFLNIQVLLVRLNDKLSSAVKSLQKGVERLEGAKAEVQAAKTHVGNMGRVMAGKETKDTPIASDRGILSGIQKVFKKTGSVLSEIGHAVDSAITKVDTLGQKTEKSSVRDNLKTIQNTRTESKDAIEKGNIDIER